MVLYIASFNAIAYKLHPPKDIPARLDIHILSFGSCAFLMLTVILSIGPLARLDRRFLPLLYNRRHFGVLTFIVALIHVYFMLRWYAVQGALPNLVTELTTWGDYAKFIGFPFKVLGARCAADPLPDGGDQPRFLAWLSHAAGLEGACTWRSTSPTGWW